MTSLPAAGPRWVGAVLTGGRSSRMGRDKALLEVGGVPMAVHVAGVLRDAGADPVVCVGGDLAGLRAWGLAAEPDPWQGEGPLGGVVSAFDLAETALRGLAPPGRPAALVVVACDLPRLDAGTPAALVARLLAEPELDVVCARTDRPEPLCAAWRPRARWQLWRAFEGGERAIHRAWAPLRRAEVEVDAALLRDVDRPEDLDGS